MTRRVGESAVPITGAAIKFCGIVRVEDAVRAAQLGAAFVGSIFAGGPRMVSTATARANAEAARATGAPNDRAPLAVGVMGVQAPDTIARLADEATLDVVQLHAEPDARAVAAVRRVFGGRVWAVLSLPNASLPAHAPALFDVADAVVLDAKVPGHAFGGTGVTLPWAALVDDIARLRGAAPLVLAGGLRPENVADAVALLAPDVVDVASGIEASPGVKDHARMAAFALAVARTPTFQIVRQVMPHPGASE